MAWMFKKISPGFIRKGREAGVDAGNPRIVWFTVKRKLEKRMDDARKERERIALAEAMRKELPKVQSALANAVEEHDSFLAGCEPREFSWSTRQRNGNEVVLFARTDAGERDSVSVKVNFDHDMKAEYTVAFALPEGEGFGMIWKASSLTLLKTAVKERGPFWAPDLDGGMFELHARTLADDVDLPMHDVNWGKFERLVELGVGRLALANESGKAVLLGRDRDADGEERLTLYGIPQRFSRHSEKIVEDLNGAGFSAVRVGGQDYLIRFGRLFELEGQRNHDPGDARLMTYRLRVPGGKNE